MAEFTERILGDTGLKVGPLGMAASYGAPAEAFEEAFDRGCNYFYLGGGRRKAEMKQAIRNICGQGCRDKLVIAIQSYARSGYLMEWVFKSRLRSMGLERADILVLGWHNRRPSPGLVTRAQAMKAKGLCRYLAMSGHQRKLFPQMAADGQFDLFHVRYNAAHRGAQEEIFPHLQGDDRPGIVSYTATRWGQLLNPKKMPPADSVPAPSDCYRFALSNPAVDVCLCGPKNVAQMRDALPALELGPLDAGDTERMKRIGDFVRSTTRKF
ncbi:Aldo/keto reductase [Olavius sp. associated proteobacterium Delta 1]|nr:Aldo/keto reductase [Olavius sp. associated proteobacterium Delta 1]